MEGSRLQLTKDGSMIKYGSRKTFSDASRSSVGGKKFKSLEDAFRDVKVELAKIGKKNG